MAGMPGVRIIVTIIYLEFWAHSHQQNKLKILRTEILCPEISWLKAWNITYHQVFYCFDKLAWS